jgi:hypothetical protein
MTNVNNRNRVQAGIKTGGQFAAEMHSEPAGVTLMAETSPLDKTAVGIVAAMVRSKSAIEMGRWQRRQEDGLYGYEHESREPTPAVLMELDGRAKAFEALPRQEQDDILDQLKMPGAKHLLEPGQQLGNDKVQVADNLDTDGGNIGLALVAQKVVADAGIPGTITLTEIRDGTWFTVQDGNITHAINVGPTTLSLSASSGDESDYDRDCWLDRADIISAGGTVFDPERAEDLRRHYESHREYAVMMDVVSGSSFKGVNDDPEIGELDRSARTAELKVDGAEYLLDVSGSEPALKTDEGKALHPSMTRGFLDHMAARTGHADGETFAANLREVFRETDRRLIP